MSWAYDANGLPTWVPWIVGEPSASQVPTWDGTKWVPAVGTGPQQIFRFNDTSTSQFGSEVKIGPTVGGSVVASFATSTGIPELVLTGTNNGGVHVFPMTLTGARYRRFRMSFIQHNAVPASGGLIVGALASDDSVMIGFLQDSLPQNAIAQVWSASSSVLAFPSSAPIWSGNNPLKYIIDFDIPTTALATGNQFGVAITIYPASGSAVTQYKRTTVNANLNGKTLSKLCIGTGDVDPTTDDDTFAFSDIHVENL